MIGLRRCCLQVNNNNDGGIASTVTDWAMHERPGSQIPKSLIQEETRLRRLTSSWPLGSLHRGVFSQTLSNFVTEYRWLTEREELEGIDPQRPESNHSSGRSFCVQVFGVTSRDGWGGGRGCPTIDRVPF